MNEQTNEPTNERTVFYPDYLMAPRYIRLQRTLGVRAFLSPLVFRPLANSLDDRRGEESLLHGHLDKLGDPL